jgi:hypothetical protein
MSFRVLTAGLWLASVLLLLFMAPNHIIALLSSKAQLMEGLTASAIVTLFAWTLVEIALKAWHIWREHLAVDTVQQLIAKADRGIVNRPVPFDLRQPRATRRTNLIIECGKADVARLHEAVPAAAGLDATIMAASYGPFNVYAWVLPVLGFIGTASGMAEAIGGFKDALGQTREFEVLVATLSQKVIPGLASAFQITIIALGASLVVYSCTSALRAWDQEALNSLDRLCIVMLSRIPLPEGPEGQKTVLLLDQIRRLLEGVVSVPIRLESAAEAIGEAAAALRTASKELHESASAPYIVTVRRGEG